MKVLDFKSLAFRLSVICFSVICFSVLRPPAPAHAAIPQLINFQGKVTCANATAPCVGAGVNVPNGSYTFLFKLYTASSGGSPVWTETQSLTVTDGIFQANLDAVNNDNFSGVNFSNTVYLGVTFNGDPEASPRVQFTPSPYALNAGLLGGIASSGYVQLAPGSIQGDGSTNTSIFINKTAAGNLLQFQNNATPVYTISNTGALTIQNSTNSANILQVQNAGGEQLLNIDATDVAGNLLVDPSFEAGISNWPTLGVGTPTLTNATDAYYIGKKSFKIATNGTANEGVKYVVGAVGSISQLFRVYSLLGSGTMSTLQVGYSNDGTTLTTCLSGKSPVTGGWTSFTCPITWASPNSSAFIYVRDTGTSHTFYLDGLILTTTGSTTPQPYRDSAVQLGGILTSPVTAMNDFNSVTAFQIQNAVGTGTIFSADTLNNQLTINAKGGGVFIGETGANAGASTVHIADTSDASTAQVVTVGSIAAVANVTTIQAGNSGTAAVVIQAAASGAINIGTNAVTGKTINLASVGSTSNATTVHIADTSDASVAQVITIGSIAAAAHTTTIQGGNNASAITLQTAASGSINIAANNVAGKIVNIGSVGSTAFVTTIHIADTSDTSAAQSVTIGSIGANAANTTTIQGGNTASAIILQTAASGSINIGANNVAGKIVNIGSVGSTAQATTIHIADTSDTSASQSVTIGDITAGSSTVTIQGGNTSSAISLQTAASGSVNIGTNSVSGKIVNIGSVGSTANATTIHIADTSDATVTQAVTIGSNSATTNTLTLQGGNTVGAITAKVASGGTINLASLTSAASNVISGTVATTVSSSTVTTKISSPAPSTLNNAYQQIAISSDGLPIIAIATGSNTGLAVIHCTNVSCSASAGTNITGANGGANPTVAIGSDGLPIVLSFGSSGAQVVHCTNLTCSNFTLTVPDATLTGISGSAIVIGTDGLPLLAVQDGTNHDLAVIHCTTVTCSSSSTTKYTDANLIGSGTSITIGTDGMGIISTLDSTTIDLVVYHCSNTACTSTTKTTYSDAGDIIPATGGGIIVGSDGLPIISTVDTAAGTLKVYHCSNTSCTSATSSTITDPSSTFDNNTGIAIGPDGLPVIAAANVAAGQDLTVVKCLNVTCSSQSFAYISDADSYAGGKSVAIGSDGLPIITSIDTSSTGSTAVFHCGNASCSGSSSVLSGGTSLGSANSFFQSAYIQGINTGSAVNPFTIATNGITRLTFDALGNITAATGSVFNVGAATGITTTCSSGQLLQNEVITGGIVTGGSCATASGGSNTLQAAYTASTGGSTPEIVLDTTRNGLNIQDASGTPVTGDLFDVQNNGGTFNYLAVATTTISLDTAASGTINIGEANVSGKTINVGSVGSTAQATTIHIADTSATTGQVLTIGSNSAGTNTTTIQGGNTAAAITLQTAASGSINIATNNVATKTINIGSIGSTAQATTIHIADTTDATTAQTLTIGSASATTNQTTLQGGTGVGAVTLATAAGGTINVGSLAFFSGTASNAVPTVIATTTSSTTATTKFSDADNVGQYSSETIGSDGLPIISSYDAGSALDLAVTHCSNIACTSSTTTKFSNADDIGSYSSIKIGTDGLAIISSYDATTFDVAVTHCSNISCTSSTTTVISNASNVGQFGTSITIGTDGLPIISTENASVSLLDVIHCSNITCTSSTSTEFSDSDIMGRYSSIVVGTDGLPIISQWDTTPGDLAVMHCSNVTCTSSTLTKFSDADNVGQYSSITIGVDGLAIISSYDITSTDLAVTHCTNTACTSSGTTKFSDADNVGAYSSIKIGTDGLAVVSSYDFTAGKLDLTVTHCTNVACTSSATTKLSDSDDVGRHTSLAIGTDGLPIISHYNTTNGDLAVTHCGDVTCSTTSSTLSGGLSLGSQSNAFQKVYATGISTTDAVNPFTIATNGITRLTVDYGGNITAASGSVFNVGAAAGNTLSCSAGQPVTGATYLGGITTGSGSCTPPSQTLQASYTASTSPEITVDATRGALTVQDNSTPIGANLLEVTANGGGTTYFGVSAASTTILGGNNSTAVNIQSGASGTIQIGTANAANTVNISTGAASSKTTSIGNNATGSSTNTVTIGSTVGTSKTTIQGGSGDIILTTSTGNVVQVGAAATDTTQVLFAADSFSTFSDTASCATSTNQGALYYSTNTNSLRACISGGQSGSIWDDVVTNSDLGLQLFGVVPDSGPTPGDWVGINGTLASAGPCKVYLGSANTKIRWTACTAFSGGRKVIVAAQAADYTVTLTSGFTHICLDTSGVVAASAGLNGTEITNLPTFSATAPLLCLADLAVNGSAITEIYDTRTFTTTTKELTNNVTNAAGLGWIETQTATAGQVTRTSTTAGVGTIVGVVVATGGGTTANAINVIIATAGPAYVKGVTTANPIGNPVINSTTAGYALIQATVSLPVTQDFASLGISLSGFTATCGTLADTCRGSYAVNLNIK